MASSFRGDGSYEGWLLRIAWRQFLSSSRSQRQQPEIAASQEQSFEADPAPGMDIGRAFQSLTPDERAAAILCLGEGHSHSEAAMILELPLGTLKSTVARARLKLANYLGETTDDR